jgi:hypothetical protein
MKKIALYLFVAFAFVIGNASALGISSANFGYVEPGSNNTQVVTLVNSQNDFDNHFVIQIDGAVKSWITVSPSEFDLAKGNVMQITLVLKVPENATLGEFKGTVTAVGKKTVPTGESGGGASVGYAIATKGNIYVSVIKPGALASVEITAVEAPPSIPAGSVARFTVTSKNNGNINGTTTASFRLDIKKDGMVIANAPAITADFAPGEEKAVKLLWDTQGVADGRYDAYVEAVTVAKGSEKTSSTTYNLPVVIGEEKGSSGVYIAAGIVALIIILAVVVMRRK